MVPTHDGTTAGGTGGSRSIRLPKFDSLFGKSIDVGRLHWGRLVDVIAFDILPAQVIREDQYDVWLSGALLGRGSTNSTENKQ
tara:strand:+ start:88 stop:336 length:249 start_codon:yes stop_codon:yes gene_type:complete